MAELPEGVVSRHDRAASNPVAMRLLLHHLGTRDTAIGSRDAAIRSRDVRIESRDVAFGSLVHALVSEDQTIGTDV